MDLNLLQKNKKIWELFVKSEEYSPVKLDKHKRFLYKYSKYKNVLQPYVSEYLLKKGITFQYPENKEFSICLTHDVDIIYPPHIHKIFSLVTLPIHKEIHKLNQLLTYKKNIQNPYLTFTKIMELEKSYGAKSCFYFLTSKNDIKKNRYNIHDLSNVLGVIKDRQWEIGLHGGYYSFNKKDELYKEKTILEREINKNVIGYRGHYLRFETPNTWSILEQVGFKYDSTYGYADMIGFRNGVCHPFKPYNLNTNSRINILEIPLNLIDGTLDYFRYSPDSLWKILENVLLITKKNSGVLTILFHTDLFSCPYKSTLEKLYTKILSFGKINKAWITNPGELFNWWIKNGY